MSKLRVFISGQKWFGQEVFRLCNAHSNVEIMGVCAPAGDKYLGAIALRFNVPIIAAGTLNGDTMPDNVDLGITAHSFDYIGKKTRYKTTYGWIGYHPSLLPLHRGRSSIEWAVKMRDTITGGTVFWLNSGIDRGDIAYQSWCFIDSAYYGLELKKAARLLWEHNLQPIGFKLIEKALDDISVGVIRKVPQSSNYGSFEPSIDVKDIFKPDLLMIEQFGSPTNR